MKSIQPHMGSQARPLAIYLWFALVNSKSSSPIISRSEGADMLRRKTGCLTAWEITFVSDADLQARMERNKRVDISATPFGRAAETAKHGTMEQSRSIFAFYDSSATEPAGKENWWVF